MAALAAFFGLHTQLQVLHTERIAGGGWEVLGLRGVVGLSGIRAAEAGVSIPVRPTLAAVAVVAPVNEATGSAGFCRTIRFHGFP